MSNFREVTFGERLFSRIDDNAYLQELYQNILFNYSKRLFRLDETAERPVNIGDALTFADVLSKSCGTNLSDIHKTRAQEMAALLYDMYPQNEQVQYYLGSILANTGNFLGMKRLTPDFENASLLERVFMRYNMDYLSVPYDDGLYFFPAQKEIFDSFSKPYFSYSAPTSMGKSFMMRVFIKEQILHGAKKNFALLLPTKALINEVTSELIESLTTLLEDADYRIVTSSGSMVLEKKHNYIFAVTPERMLYILINDPDLMMDYLFVDEAHKVSSGDKRSTFYYKVIEKLEERHNEPHIIFASPNIPNPRVYLETLSKSREPYDEEPILACKYAPVSQMKYIVDLRDCNIRIYDSYSKKFIDLHKMSRPYTLSEVISRIGDRRHNIVYCKSKNDAIQFAMDYAGTQNPIGDKKLQAFAEAIRSEVHTEYYLAGLVERGVAYHIGYLPANIRMRLEDYYREGLIKTLFCTSTLLEGVNLPAENLFITSYKKGRSSFSEVDFKNLVGRVGRAKYNLYGNVFLIRLQKQECEKDLRKYENLLKDDVPPQKLSIKANLDSHQKELIVYTLLTGSVEIPKSSMRQSEDNYMGLFVCSACYRVFKTEAMPDSCPFCHSETVLGMTDSGRKISLPAVRPATGMEVQAYEDVNGAVFAEKAFLKRVDNLSTYGLSDDEYHVALMLLFFFKSTPVDFTSRFLNDLLPANSKFFEKKSTQTISWNLYESAKKHFTAQISRERRFAEFKQWLSEP